MNSLFIYLFFEIVGHRWFNGYISAISNGLLGFIHTPELLSQDHHIALYFWIGMGTVLFSLPEKNILYSIKSVAICEICGKKYYPNHFNLLLILQ
jgi:hypothetical protein